MHPIERLRMVARATGEGPSLLAREAAGAMAAFADDPAGLVTACRRLVDRQPTSGPMWWLAARVLAAADPRAEAWRAADELDADTTAAVLESLLPPDATVTIVGWPPLTADALRRRGDLTVLVVDAGGDGRALARRLAAHDVAATGVADDHVAGAVAASQVVVLEASAVGPAALVARAGSRAAAAVARSTGVEVWAVAGAGSVLPGPLADALLARLARSAPPWETDEEPVPLDLVDAFVGPTGREEARDRAARPDCPVAPELLREIG